MATIFLPLSLDVWLLHVAMMGFGGAAILFMEATASRLRCAGCVDYGEQEEGADGEPHLSPNGLLKTFFASLVHFLWNGPKHAPRTAMGKLALFALSFHTLVIAASYTASLAGFLATSSTLPIQVLIIVCLHADVRSYRPVCAFCVFSCACVNARKEGK